MPGRQGRHLAPQGIPAGTALVVFPGQAHQFIIQGIQLCCQLPARQLHALCHSAVAFQRGGGLGAVLLPGGDLCPQVCGAFLVAGNIVFQHGDPALAAADLLGDAADIPIQALDRNGQLLCLHPDLLSLALGGFGLAVEPLIIGLGCLVIPHLTAHGFLGPVHAVRPQGHLQRFAPGAQFQKLPGLFALFFQRAHPGLQLAQDIPQAFQIFGGGGKAALGLVFAVAVFGNAAGFLKDLPALAALGRHDLGNAALPDD